MVNMNDQMRKIISNDNDQKRDEKMHEFLKGIINKTKIIRDCVIYDDEGIHESDVDFDSVLKMVGDLTGYEVNCNEFRYEKNKIINYSCLDIATDLNHMLENKHRNRKFVIYVCVGDEHIEIRFHTYRETEGSWLDEDLNKYNKPILCFIQGK